MIRRKRLMVLGAGWGQMPLIRKGVSLGLHVITVDNVAGNPGHSISQASVNCSTIDREGVLQAAIRHGIDGVVTFASDLATPTVAFVADRLSLRGCPVDTAETMSDKIRFRHLQRGNPDLALPAFAAGRDFDSVFEAAALQPPLMFKPADTSGSRGISRVDECNWDAYRDAFDLAQSFSRSGAVCVEQFVAGYDASGDGFLIDGRLFAVVTRKHKHGFVPTGHSLPGELADPDRLRVLAEVQATCAAAGYTDGPLDFDVVVAPEGVTVIEMSPRLGGNGIPALIERATGVDLTMMTLRWALDEPVRMPDTPAYARPCGSWIFGSPAAGFLRTIASSAEVMAAVPECFECILLYKEGDIAPAFTHSGNALGSVLFDCTPDAPYEIAVSRIENALRIGIEAVFAKSLTA